MQHTIGCATWDHVPGPCDCGAKTRERRSQQMAAEQLQQRCTALESEVAALRAQVPPAGWVAVPTEPPIKALREFYKGPWDTVTAAYKRIIEAARAAGEKT